MCQVSSHEMDRKNVKIFTTGEEPGRTEKDEFKRAAARQITTEQACFKLEALSDAISQVEFGRDP